MTINNPVNVQTNTLNFSGGSFVMNGAISGTGSLNSRPAVD